MSRFDYNSLTRLLGKEAVDKLGTQTGRWIEIDTTRPEYKNALKNRPRVPESKKATQRIPLARCQHRGEPTGATVECPTCSGRVKLKLFGCAVYGSCVTVKRVDGVASCVGCKDYVDTSPTNKAT